MHFIRLILISAIVLFIVITGISLFIPSHVRVSRAIDMTATRVAVMSQLRDPANWKNWYPGMDKAALIQEDNRVVGIGIGSSKLIIDKVGENEVKAISTNKKMKPVTTVWQVVSSGSGAYVTVNWYMEFQLRWYPWEKFRSLLLEKTYGPMLERGLSNLKKSVEN
jgi:hypothetical protein